MPTRLAQVIGTTQAIITLSNSFSLGFTESRFFVAAHVEDFYFRMNGPYLIGQLPAAFVRHDQISQQEVNRLRVALGQSADKPPILWGL